MAEIRPSEYGLLRFEGSTYCPLWFTLTPPASLEMDAMVQMWLRRHLYAFLPISLLLKSKDLPRSSPTIITGSHVHLLGVMPLLNVTHWEIPILKDPLSQVKVSLSPPATDLETFEIWEHLSAGLAPATLKVYVDSFSLATYLLMELLWGSFLWFLFSARQLRPICRPQVSFWDLSSGPGRAI